MHLLISNISWMSFNIFLALVAVLFGWLMKKTTGKLLQVMCGVVWILFLPNTLYLLTDIVHFFTNLQRVEGLYKLVLIIQYLLLLLLGVSTYFAAVYPAEKVFVKRMKWKKTTFIIVLSVLVGFGMTLGRIERINSWNILTNILRVMHAGTKVLMSIHLVILILVFATMSTLIYFSLQAIMTRAHRKLRGFQPQQ